MASDCGASYMLLQIQSKCIPLFMSFKNVFILYNGFHVDIRCVYVCVCKTDTECAKYPLKNVNLFLQIRLNSKHWWSNEKLSKNNEKLTQSNKELRCYLRPFQSGPAHREKKKFIL